jgi:hypothetical protein
MDFSAAFEKSILSLIGEECSTPSSTIIGDNLSEYVYLYVCWGVRGRLHFVDVCLSCTLFESGIADYVEFIEDLSHRN